ncbi:MAG TPA: MarR family transcriptional regulator [Acidimicrobiales bacterium]
MKSSASTAPLLQVPDSFEQEFPDASALATESFINIGVLAGAVQGLVEKLVAREGLPSAAAFNVLSVLAGDPAPLRPSVIADRMMVTRATTTGLLDTLEGGGFVLRTRAATDGRSREVSLTRKGREVVDRLVPAMHRFERHLMGSLTDRQLHQLLRMVAVLQARVASIDPDVRFGIRA